MKENFIPWIFIITFIILGFVVHIGFFVLAIAMLYWVG